jgi:hypothetical protein
MGDTPSSKRGSGGVVRRPDGEYAQRRTERLRRCESPPLVGLRTQGGKVMVDMIDDSN